MRAGARVLMTADTVGGVWSHSVELTRGLCARGVEVALATMGGPLSPEQWNDVRGIRGLEVFESRYALEWMDQPWEDVERAGAWLLELAQGVRPDVVHLNGYAHGALPFDAPVLVVAHSCVCSWWRAVLGEDAPDRYARYRREVAAGIAAATLVVAPSRAMLRALAAHHGAPKHGRLIPNGIRLDAWAPRAKEPFVLSAARLWDRAKNADAVARVASRIAWPVRIAGDATAPPGAGERWEAPAGVEVLGRLDRAALGDRMARAAIFAHPARYEPFGLAPLEAAASGCALVLGDIDSLREVWGRAAVFVPPDDDDALAHALATLIGDGARRRELADRAREHARRYADAVMVDAYFDVYRELAALGRPPRRTRPPGPAAELPVSR